MKIIDWLKKNLIVLFLILGAIGASFILGKCSTRKMLDTQVSNILALKDTVKASTVVINGLTTEVYQQRALILSQKDALASNELEKEVLKKLNMKLVVTQTDLEGTIVMLRDHLAEVPGTTIITVKDTSGSHEYVKIPFTLLDVQDEDITLLAGMSLNKTAYFSLRVPFNGKITIGWQKDGFLKTKPVGVFITTNQYIKISDINALIVQDPKKWYDKTWVHLAIGGVAAITIQHFLK
jgi:hypothetical protein